MEAKGNRMVHPDGSPLAPDAKESRGAGVPPVPLTVRRAHCSDANFPLATRLADHTASPKPAQLRLCSIAALTRLVGIFVLVCCWADNPASAQDVRDENPAEGAAVREPATDADPVPEDPNAEAIVPDGEEDDGGFELQDGAVPSEDVEDILVLGAASGLASQEVPTSSIDFDAEQVLDLGIQDIRDLSSYTPNLEIKTAFAAVNPTIFIRGVGLDDFNANSASAVSIYADGVYMYSPAGQLFGLYDVESIEVLRGPRPTLTNASAGAILIRSRLPSDEFEAYLTTTLGLDNRSGFVAGYNERTYQGALNIPLVPDMLAFRGSFKVRTRDGITENACAPRIRRANELSDPADKFAELGICVTAAGLGNGGVVTSPSSVESLVNDVDNWAARGLLSFHTELPGDQEIDLLLNFNAGKNNSLATQYQHRGLSASLPDPETLLPGPQTEITPAGNFSIDRFNYTEQLTEGDPFAGEYDRIGPEKLDLLGTSLTANWSISDSLEVESLTAYVFHDRKTYANDDAGPKLWLDSDYIDKSNQASQELSLRWLFGDDNEATLGGSFLYEDVNGDNLFRNRRIQLFIPGEPPGFFAFDQEFRQETTQWGIYGVTRFALPALGGAEFLSNFEVGASLRYNWAEKNFSQASLGVRGTATRFPANIGSESDTWDDVAGDVSLSYFIGEFHSIYGKYSRGWKPGHFSLGTLTSGVPLTPVEPETVDSFEIGARTLWFDGMVQADLTLFYYDYRDLQVFQTTVDPLGNILRRLINAKQASVQGAELDLSVEPIEGLTLAFNGAYLDSEYDEFSTSFERTRRVPGGDPPVQTIDIEQDYSGNRLIASPVWSFNVNASYEFSLGRYGFLRPWYAVAYKDEIFFGPNEGLGAEGTLVERLLREPAYWLHNAGLTYTFPWEGFEFEVGIWVRNFLDKEYRIQSFDISIPNRIVLDVYGDPRTAGLNLTIRFQ